MQRTSGTVRTFDGYHGQILIDGTDEIAFFTWYSLSRPRDLDKGDHVFFDLETCPGKKIPLRARRIFAPPAGNLHLAGY